MMSNSIIIEVKKVVKLLELYKELATTRADMLSCCEVVDDEYYDIEEIETDLEQQIKELENETIY